MTKLHRQQSSSQSDRDDREDASCRHNEVEGRGTEHGICICLRDNVVVLEFFQQTDFSDRSAGHAFVLGL